MKKIIISSSVIVSVLSIGSISYACDMHGAGFGGYGLRNAPWQSYEPQVSTTDPALAETENLTPAPVAKPKPSFSNAANLAAMKAKARLAKKQEDEKKRVEDADVKKAALNADR